MTGKACTSACRECQLQAKCCSLNSTLCPLAVMRFSPMHIRVNESTSDDKVTPEAFQNLCLAAVASTATKLASFGPHLLSHL